jgi:hypothetical protein
MGIKKFIVQVKESFQLDKLQKTRKRESMQRLLAKLRSKKETFNNIAKETLGNKEIAELKENLAIITLQIKKGELILEKLSA